MKTRKKKWLCALRSCWRTLISGGAWKYFKNNGAIYQSGCNPDNEVRAKGWRISTCTDCGSKFYRIITENNEVEKKSRR